MARITRATIQAAGREVHGEYHGGPYIDLSFGDGRAFEVINVWNYETDRPTIANTTRAVRHAMIEWRNAAGDSLAHDLREYALSIR
jgi:hypothetical protein